MRLNCTIQEKKRISHGCRDTRSSPTVVCLPTLEKFMTTMMLLRPQASKTLNLSRSKPFLIVASTKTDGRSLPNSKLQENLRVLDKLLAKNDEDSALNLVSSLSSNGIMKAFSGANQIPKRAYSLEELRLNKIEPSQFLAPTDSTLGGVRSVMQGSLLLGLLAAYFSETIAIDRLVQLAVFVAALLTTDQILNAGGMEALLLDTAARVISPSYKRRVALHESGHFLIAYLVGILPKSYTLSSWDAFISRRALNVQAGTTFCDSLFQKEVSSGRLTSSSLDKYTCVALAGVATEWLRFGYVAISLMLLMILREISISSH